MRESPFGASLLGGVELKRTIEPGEISDTWDAEALYNKAQRYAQRMVEAHENDWEYALWSSL